MKKSAVLVLFMGVTCWGGPFDWLGGAKELQCSGGNIDPAWKEFSISGRLNLPLRKKKKGKKFKKMCNKKGFIRFACYTPARDSSQPWTLYCKDKK